jgi:hypothetical protein
MSFVVFVLLAVQKLPKPYLHAFYVATLTYLMAKIPVSVLIGEFNYTVLSAIENTFTLIAMFLGTYVGLAFSRKKVQSTAT